MLFGYLFSFPELKLHFCPPVCDCTTLVAHLVAQVQQAFLIVTLQPEKVHCSNLSKSRQKHGLKSQSDAEQMVWPWLSPVIKAALDLRFNLSIKFKIIVLPHTQVCRCLIETSQESRSVQTGSILATKQLYLFYSLKCKNIHLTPTPWFLAYIPDAGLQRYWVLVAYRFDCHRHKC